MQEAKKLITLTDRRIFWEMVRAIIELPSLRAHLKPALGLKSARELSNLLKRTENRILWTIEASECLPKEIAMELISNAYTPPTYTNI